jgi:hypothetical protein
MGWSPWFATLAPVYWRGVCPNRSYTLWLCLTPALEQRFQVRRLVQVMAGTAWNLETIYLVKWRVHVPCQGALGRNVHLDWFIICIPRVSCVGSFEHVGLGKPPFRVLVKACQNPNDSVRCPYHILMLDTSCKKETGWFRGVYLQDAAVQPSRVTILLRLYNNQLSLYRYGNHRHNCACLDIPAPSTLDVKAQKGINPFSDADHFHKWKYPLSLFGEISLP